MSALGRKEQGVELGDVSSDRRFVKKRSNGHEQNSPGLLVAAELGELFWDSCPAVHMATPWERRAAQTCALQPYASITAGAQ